MSKIETCGPAFPVVQECGLDDPAMNGQTLRDYFAAKAMAALIAKCQAYDPVAEKQTQNAVAKLAYMFSDAMIGARK